MRPNPNIAPVEWPYRDCFAREEWRPCPGYADRYEVSSFGNVRRTGSRLRNFSPDGDGYPMVSFHRPGRTPKNHKVHQLVCRAFHGEPTALHREVAHLDGDRANNRASNLKWVSHAENISHKRDHGTAQVGSRHPRAKLTEGQVRELRASRLTQREIAIAFGISRHTVSDIQRRIRWKHVA